MKFTKLAAIALISLGATATYAQDSVKIGALIPLSGNYGFLGVSERYGIDMALEEINAGGGVLGRQVEVQYEDSGTAAQATRKATRMLQNDGVDFFVNGGGSSVSTAMAEFAARNKVIDLALDPNSEELVRGKANRYFFLVPPPSSMIANAFVPEVAKLGDSVFFLTHDYSYGIAQTTEQRRVLEEIGDVEEVGEIRIPLGTRDFSSQIIAVRNAKPDVLIVNVAGIDSTALLEQIWEFGLYNDMQVAIPLLDFEDSWAIGADKNEMIALAGVEWHYNISDKAQAFKDRYQEKYPNADFPVPTTNSVNAYLGVRILLQAAEAAGSLESEAVVKQLETMTLEESLKMNPLTVRAADHQIVQDFVIVKVKPEAEREADYDLYEVVTVAAGADIVSPEAEATADMSAFD
ncbi:ABC transporter substrate-binding protein [Oceanibium sediminis]|uniref:ABC transporter substrate-binding protein n=1 Tax=Oceanibium sediminis TaxID=2026339 RepID=UPI000DD36649|nr:ABC transporter substrate-binding protein [Oceanibium sediminis]